MPVLVEESPGVTTPLDWTLPVMVPFPKREPDWTVNRLPTDRVPSSVVVPLDCVRLPDPPTVKVLPLPIVNVPALVKLPAVVKLRLLLMVKLPPDALVAKFARPLLLLWSSICDEVPVSVRLAALVTMFAPLNCSVPVRL